MNLLHSPSNKVSVYLEREDLKKIFNEFMSKGGYPKWKD